MKTSGYSFEDLEVYKSAREFRKKILLLIKALPHEEKYVLQPQMRRAAISITTNIAEGHGRFHFQENIQFLRHSRGSLQEVIDDLSVCLDEKYLAPEQFDPLKSEASEVLKKLNGYAAYLRSRKNQEN